MIYAAPGSTIEAAVQGLPPSLPAGTVGVSVKDKPAGGAVVQARATAGITEDPAGSGFYGKSDLVAPTTAGTFWLHWDSGLNTAPFAVEELVVTHTAPVAAVFAVVPGDVAALLRARTKDNSGNEGAFTANTRPTATQVEQLIVVAGSDVAARTGTIDPVVDATLAALANRLVAIRAAMLVEMSYFPEQIREGQSAYDALERLYTEGMDALQDTAGLARPERGVVSVPLRGDAAFDSLTGKLWP